MHNSNLKILGCDNIDEIPALQLKLTLCDEEVNLPVVSNVTMPWHPAARIGIPLLGLSHRPQPPLLGVHPLPQGLGLQLRPRAFIEGEFYLPFIAFMSSPCKHIHSMFFLGNTKNS